MRQTRADSPDSDPIVSDVGLYLRPSQLARLVGISTDTLRHYERVGVLPKPVRTLAGYRQYDPSSVERVRLVRNALAVGFTLAEIAQLLHARERAEQGRGEPPCHDVYALAVAKRAQVEERLREFAVLREELCTLIADWQERLAAAQDNTPVRLLEHFSACKSATTERLPESPIPIAPQPGLTSPIRKKDASR